MPSTIILSDAEARAAAEGRLAALVRPFWPQPEVDMKSLRPANPREPYVKFNDESGLYDFYGSRGHERNRQSSMEVMRSPFGPTGGVLRAREAFYDDKYEHPETAWPRHGTPSFTGFYRATEPARNVRWRPASQMPAWASRFSIRVVAQRACMVQELTEAEALATGMNQEDCEKAFLAAPGCEKPDYAWWTEDADENQCEEYLCGRCAAKATPKGGSAHYDPCPHESDGPANCDNCGAALLVSLTQYGIENELFLQDDSLDNRKYFSLTSSSASVAAMIAGGIGDLQDEHLGRLAQIGFATAWNRRHRRPELAWEANPWVAIALVEVQRKGESNA